MGVGVGNVGNNLVPAADLRSVIKVGGSKNEYFRVLMFLDRSRCLRVDW